MKLEYYKVKRFNSSLHVNDWNVFIKSAKSATFLFDRNFMDYHSDRFDDHSLIIYDEKEDILACFPANQVNENEIISHQGLTYGGIAIRESEKLQVHIRVFYSILRYYHTIGFSIIRIKIIPRFYNNYQTDEIDYCMFIFKAKLYRRDTSICIDRSLKINFSKNILRDASNAEKDAIFIKEEEDFSDFWSQALIPNLSVRYGVKPVHSLDDIVLLKSRFKEEIKLFSVYSNQKKLLAGTILFISNNVVHCQYIAATDDGRKTNALTYLFVCLTKDYFKDRRYFDFGIVNENQGRVLNQGMLLWKQRLGGSPFSQDFYEIETKNLVLLN